MNIFALNSDPHTAAKMLKWGHVNKMILESTQMLSNVLPPETAPYKRSHYHHPCSRWVRASYSNFQWLVDYSLELCRVYTQRQNRFHACQKVITGIDIVVSEKWAQYFDSYDLTPFATAMPEMYVIPNNPVQSYIDYYREEKSHIRS